MREGNCKFRYDDVLVNAGAEVPFATVAKKRFAFPREADIATFLISLARLSLEIQRGVRRREPAKISLLNCNLDVPHNDILSCS